MSEYSGLIAELDTNATIPGKQLEAIMTAYPSCWGYAAPITDKQGHKKLLMAATKIPEGWAAKDIQDMKAQLQGTPEMMEYFGKFPAHIDDVCMQPFPLLEDDKGNVLLCLLMEGDYDHWKKEDEESHTNLSPEYICYRDMISPLVLKLETHCRGDVSQIVKELADPVYRDILEGTFEKRGVMHFLAYNGASQLIEGENDKRKDEDWGSVSNEVPEIKEGTSPEPIEEKIPETAPELSLAEKRKLRQANANKAAQQTADGVHATTATPRPVSNVKNTTISEQRIRETTGTSTAIPPSKGPFLFTLPQTIKTEAEAKNYWQTNFGTCPDMWKHKDKDGNWLPSYTAGFPYEKSAKNSIIRDKFNADGSPKSSGKGFAAIDNLAKGSDFSTQPVPAGGKGAADHDSRPPTTPVKLPLMPTAVRDKVISEITKLDLKSRTIMSNEEIKETEKKLSTFYAQLQNTPVEHLWRLSYAEIDRLNRTYPDFGSVWLFALRNFQIQNWKRPEEPKKEETVVETVLPEAELTLAQKRALRKKPAA